MESMARFTGNIPKDTFEFTVEMGKRLAELRRRAGLRQSDVASIMGRKSRRGQSIVSRLETGEKPRPTMQLVADYLRACRATFADIAPVLDTYTRKPTRAEKQVQKKLAGLTQRLPKPVASATLKYDIKLAQELGPKAAQPKEAERRLARARKYAQAAVWRDRLHKHILGIISAKKWGRGVVMESRLQDYCRRVWAVLEKTRDKPDAEREKRLAQAEAKMLAGWTFDTEPVRHLAQATIAYREDALRSGELG
jgi:transcriptional regulator with XRE-family HTH domain